MPNALTKPIHQSLHKIAAPLLLAALLPLAAQAQTPSADKALLPAQMDASKGPFVVDENPHHGLRIVRIQIAPNKDLPPHGPDNGYFLATVISGTLQIGFGDKFDESKLQTLPPGSVFTHPAGVQKHFARTGAEPVVLQVLRLEKPTHPDGKNPPPAPKDGKKDHKNETHNH